MRTFLVSQNQISITVYTNFDIFKNKYWINICVFKSGTSIAVFAAV